MRVVYGSTGAGSGGAGATRGEQPVAAPSGTTREEAARRGGRKGRVPTAAGEACMWPALW